MIDDDLRLDTALNDMFGLRLGSAQGGIVRACNASIPIRYGRRLRFLMDRSFVTDLDV